MGERESGRKGEKSRRGEEREGRGIKLAINSK
jgi:hypothetical protein